MELAKLTTNFLTKYYQAIIIGAVIIFLGVIYIFMWRFVLVDFPQEGYFDLALRAAKLQILDKADEYFRKTLTYNPNQPQAYVGLGRICFEQQKYKEALSYLDKAFALNLKPNNKPKDLQLASEIKQLQKEWKCKDASQ